MSLFDDINEKFFNPFGCRNKRIYFDCINILMEKSKEVSVLYETDAKICLTVYLQNCMYAIESEENGAEVSSSVSPQDNASAILAYFRGCGWIQEREIGRSGDNIAAVTAYCRKLIEAINRIFDTEAGGNITNHIFSMYEILRSALEKDSVRAMRPYTSVLAPLVEHEISLKNELLLLKDSIRDIMHSIMDITNANDFGQFLMKDRLLEKFFNDYFFLKRSGTIPGYIEKIEKMFNMIRRGSIFEGMIEEYSHIRDVSYAEAKEKVSGQFYELENFISRGYEKDITVVDKKINTYYNLYATRIAMVINNSTNLQSMLNSLLLTLKDCTEDDRSAILDRLSETMRLYSFRYVGWKSIERKKKSVKKSVNVIVPVQTPGEDEIRRMTEEILKEYPDRYSPDKVKIYFDSEFGETKEKHVSELRLENRNDHIMLAAAVIYSGTAGFPYEVEISEGMFDTGTALVSNLKMIRKGVI